MTFNNEERYMDGYNEDARKDANAELSKKFTKSEWSAIEQKFSHYALTVIDVLKDFALKDDVSLRKINYQIMGEYFYKKIRLLLEKAEYVSGKIVDDVDEEKVKKNKTKGKPIKKKGKSKEEIILESSEKHIIELVQGL